MGAFSFCRFKSTKVWFVDESDIVIVWLIRKNFSALKREFETDSS
jgi:hypothetical protein